MSFDQDRSYENNYPRPVDTTMGGGLKGPSTGGSGTDDDTSRRLDAALHAPFGIDKLLNRLKQSIYSARDFSGFMRERYALEDKYAQGYRKLVRHTSDSLRRAEARQGSYARNLDETLRVNDRLAENGLQFANALQSMADELRDIAENAEKGRKHWKHTATDHEKRLTDAENAQQRAKDKFNTAAEQYERVRTGERQGGKFGLKNKSPAQQEEALKEKADTLDQDYSARTQAAQEQRREFESAHRPQIVRALTDLIRECDAAVAMQMAKLASLSEKHVVSNGMAVAPLRSGDSGAAPPRGLRQIAQDVDDHRDFSDYMLDGVEPPSQFKGRSRRNTDADLVHTPVQANQNFGRSTTFDTPNNGNAANFESEAPQLPQIGGSEALSPGFETARPGMLEQTSYFGGQPDTLHYGPASQQTGVTQSLAPSVGAGRGMPPTSSLPSYERAQASPGGDYNSRTSLDQHGPSRQETMGPTSYDRNQGAAKPDYMTATSFDRSQGPSRQDTIVAPAYNQSQPQRQDTMGPTMFDRGNELPRQNTMGPASFDQNQQPPRYDAMSTGTDRGQPPSINAPGPFAGRGQPSPGSYMDPGRGAGSYATSPTAGRGQLPSAARNLPSQQPARPTLPPNRPVFGVHLDELFRRDGSAVPAVVFQCIQAVDTFGLHTEGIYRVPGSTPTVIQLKSEFDHDSSIVKLDDRGSFNNDISAVATLLKNFLRDLPDPLLTATAYHSFIQAAKYEDHIMRRDALHQYINSLPDPNYATLRVLVLHLHRVSMNSDINKMDIRNLSILFGPTVMGGSNVADATWQAKVMETILHRTHDIFDPDE